MALLNPVYGLIVPFLFIVTIPLAIFAGITTTLAFSILMFRVAVVYIDIALNMVPQYVTGRRIYPLSRTSYSSTLLAAGSTQSNPLYSPTTSSSGHSTPPAAISATPRLHGRQHRRRRTSGGSLNSVGSITPVDDHIGSGGSLPAGSKRNSFMLIPSIGMDRDFEGVGGWRVGGRNDDDEAWALLNSRLELPIDHNRRHHHRSPSGGGTVTPGGGAGDILMMKSRSKEGSPENSCSSRRGRERRERDGGFKSMSPNSSRQRTPTNGIPPPLTALDRDDGSYFPLMSPKSARRPV